MRGGLGIDQDEMDADPRSGGDHLEPGPAAGAEDRAFAGVAQARGESAGEAGQGPFHL